MKNICAKVIDSYQGKIHLALSNVASDPVIAQQLRVQNIPSLRVIKDGKIVEQFDGPQGERPLRQIFDKLTLSSGEALQQDLQDYVEAGDWDKAIRVVQEAINEEPSNPQFKVEAADILALKGDLNGARTLLASIPDDVADRIRPQTRIEFVEEAQTLQPIAEVKRQLEENPTNLDLHHQIAILYACDREYEHALECALEILRKDRTHRDDIGRKTMVRILNLIGKSNPLSQKYRRQMFAYMH